VEHSKSTLWEIDDLGNGIFTLKNYESGKYLQCLWYIMGHYSAETSDFQDDFAKWYIDISDENDKIKLRNLAVEDSNYYLRYSSKNVFGDTYYC